MKVNLTGCGFPLNKHARNVSTYDWSLSPFTDLNMSFVSGQKVLENCRDENLLGEDNRIQFLWTILSGRNKMWWLFFFWLADW